MRSFFTPRAMCVVRPSQNVVGRLNITLVPACKAPSFRHALFDRVSYVALLETGISQHLYLFVCKKALTIKIGGWGLEGVLDSVRDVFLNCYECLAEHLFTSNRGGRNEARRLRLIRGL